MMCTCSMGCSRNVMADRKEFTTECHCWCHDRVKVIDSPTTSVIQPGHVVFVPAFGGSDDGRD